MSVSVGTWNPKPSKTEVTASEIDGVLAAARAADLATLAATLPADFISSRSDLMKHDETAWGAIAGYSTGDIELLIRFFTLAEMQLPGWEGGKRNPVIYLVRELKQRGAFDAGLRRWIKTSTDTRSLPNGAAL